jgi:hypothetical protein
VCLLVPLAFFLKKNGFYRQFQHEVNWVKMQPDVHASVCRVLYRTPGHDRKFELEDVYDPSLVDPVSGHLLVPEAGFNRLLKHLCEMGEQVKDLQNRVAVLEAPKRAFCMDQSKNRNPSGSKKPLFQQCQGCGVPRSRRSAWYQCKQGKITGRFCKKCKKKKALENKTRQKAHNLGPQEIRVAEDVD